MTRPWVGSRRLVAGIVAVGVNVALSGLDVRHDVTLVTLLAAAAVAVGVLALEVLDANTRVPWLAHPSGHASRAR